MVFVSDGILFRALRGGRRWRRADRRLAARGRGRRQRTRADAGELREAPLDLLRVADQPADDRDLHAAARAIPVELEAADVDLWRAELDGTGVTAGGVRGGGIRHEADRAAAAVGAEEDRAVVAVGLVRRLALDLVGDVAVAVLVDRPLLAAEDDAVSVGRRRVAVVLDQRAVTVGDGDRLVRVHRAGTARRRARVEAARIADVLDRGLLVARAAQLARDDVADGAQLLREARGADGFRIGLRARDDQRRHRADHDDAERDRDQHLDDGEAAHDAARRPF